MSSKVKCTCGWSWNKSDSSKKDMYICHECGRDNSNNMRNGGWLDSYDKAQDGEYVTPSQDETSFAKDYMSSPAYYDMLKKSSEKSGEDMNMLSAMRNINLKNTSVVFPEKNTSSTPGATAESNSDTGEINVYPEAVNSPFLKGIIQHEISHSVDRPIYPGGERVIPKSDIDLISKYSNIDKNFLFTSPEFKDAKYDALRNNYRYISEPTETRARLNDIRYNAKSSKLYDPFTEKVTPEILKKIKNSKTTDAFDDLNSIYNDDQIIDLLNSVSQNKQFQKESFVAKNGGWLDSYADGGTMQEYQENYNDYKVSAPEGFKGTGYSNVGRNYSPAWGGQFQEGGEIPNAQNGIATKADSLAVYNNTRAVEDYFKKQGYTKEKVKDSKNYKERIKLNKEWITSSQKYLKEAKNEPVDPWWTQAMKNKKIAEETKYLKTAQKRLSEEREDINPKKYIKKLEESRKIFDTKGKDVGSYMDEQNNLVDGKPSAEKFYLPIDENKFYQREQSQGFLDLRSPMPLYDKRITPQDLSRFKSPHSVLGDQIMDKIFKSKNEKEKKELEKQMDALVYSDNVEMYEYDPLAVMPFDMVPLEQQEERIKKYGTSGVPQSVLDLHPEWVTEPITDSGQRKPIQAIQTKPIQNNFNIEADVPQIRPQAIIPKSFDVNSQRQTMSGPSEYYDYDQQGLSLQQAMELQARADKYNQYTQEKYKEAAKTNPKAQERYNQLMQNVEVTPNYQMGGNVYPVNYVPQAQEGKRLNPFTYPQPDHYSMNPFLVRDPQHGIFVGGINPTYSTKDFSIGASAVGVGNKDFIEPIVDYGIKGSYNPTDSLSINANISKENVGAGLRYRFQNGGEIDYPRTKGIPSNGPYAKKTLPSAQNGQEMRYYQNGLDWKPKGMKDGGWLDGYEKAQEGTKVEYGTPEYEEAYNRGKVVTDEGVRSPILLDEVVIQNNYKRPRGFWEQSRDKYLKDNADTGLLGAIGSVVTYPLSVGQHALTYGTTGKVQDPSEAWGHNTQEGWFDSPGAFGRNLDDTLLNVFADPANLFGGNILTKGKALSKLAKIPRGIAPELRQGLRTAGPSFGSSELFDLNNVRKPSGSIGNQGATSEGANNILQSLGIKVKGANPNEVTLKEMVEHLKNNPKDAATYKKFLEKEPINVSELPDGSYQINDGHHRATLSYYSGNENIPTIIKNKGEYIKKKNGGIIKDDRGQWDHPGEITEIGSNEITMQGVPYPVLGISDTGDTQMMYPEEEYEFDGEKVTEYPMARNGRRQEQKGLVNLDQLTNFTNYNKPQPGGWLNKYN